MKVSICIPAYKHLDFLKRCLDSVMEQKFIDFEVIITDDSPDDTLEKLVDTYSDNRIKYFKNEKPLGSPSNWNKGLELASGDYIKILHHDDWFSSHDSLATFIELLDDNPTVDIAFSACCNIDSHGNKKEYIVAGDKLAHLKKEPERLYLGNILRTPSCCIFRNHKKYFFDPNLIWLVDTDFYIRVAKDHSFAYSPETLVNVGISKHQITNSELANYKVRIKEKIYLYHKFQFINKGSLYRRSLLRALGREKIFNTADLRKVLNDSDLSLSRIDSLWAYYYYIKMNVGLIINK